MNRRRFLSLASGALAGSCLTPRLLPSAYASATQSSQARPRTLLQIFFAGGIDPILSLDPKRGSEIKAKVDRPYGDADIIEHDGMRLGPAVVELKNELSGMTIVNGVKGHTVAHQTGSSHVFHMKQFYPKHGAGLSGTVGRSLATRPLASIVVLDSWTAPISQYFPNPRGKILTDYYDMEGIMLCRELFGLSARSRDSAASAVASSRDMRVDPAVAEILRGWPIATRRPNLDDFTIPPMKGADPDGFLAEFNRSRGMIEGMVRNWLADLLWILESDVCDAVFIDAPVPGWDSHSFNLAKQKMAWHLTIPLLKRLFVELSRRSSSRGVPLSEEVGLIACSEMGRFPFLNNHSGKDHLPQLSVMLSGPGLRKGQFGATDSELVALPMSPASGFASSGADGILPAIDDIGATVLQWFGIDPLAVGYSGRVLPFMVEAG